MEHTFANQPSTRVFSGPGATTSPLALALSAAQQPSAASLPPRSLGVAAAAGLPHYSSPGLGSMPTALQQALAGASAGSYAASASVGADFRASLDAALGSRPRYTLAETRRARERRHRRHAPPVAAAQAPSAAASASVLESPEMEAAPPRRSTRVSRKRAPVAAAAAKPSEDVKEPATKKRRGNLKKPPPAAKKDDSEDDNKPEGEEGSPSCCICMDTPEAADLANINGCDHLYCFDCIEKWAERENTCPQCKVRFTKIDRVNKARRRGAPTKNTKRVKQKDQRSDLAPGAALEGLLASFASSANFPPHRVARLIFSGMGGNPFMLPGSASLRRGPNGASAAERASRLDDSLMSSDTDDEDEDSSSFLPAGGASIHELFRQLGAPFGAHRHPAGIVVGSAPHGLRMGTMPVFESPAAVARSYASNVGDRTAGRATNPLEIDDDSDDEDDIEVVQVTRPL